MSLWPLSPEDARFQGFEQWLPASVPGDSQFFSVDRHLSIRDIYGTPYNRHRSYGDPWKWHPSPPRARA